jgi:hypothetical protein
MNHPDEPRIAELAMKAAARQLTSAEQAEVAALQAGEPAGRREFEQRLAEAKALAEAASLLNATESRSGELPGYARERLRTKVRQTYGAPVSAPAPAAPAWTVWRRWLSVAAGAAAVVCAALLLFPAPAPLIQVAMLDPVGATRGGPNPELTALRETWPRQAVSEFRTQADVEAWGQTVTGMASDHALIIYDRSAGEIRVTGRRKGASFARAFPVETDLKPVLAEAERFVVAQFK